LFEKSRLIDNNQYLIKYIVYSLKSSFYSNDYGDEYSRRKINANLAPQIKR